MTVAGQQEIDWVKVEAFVGFCWRLAFKHDGSITSGCRSRQRNQTVGGSVDPPSKHTFAGGWGMACDFMFDTEQGLKQARAEADAKGYHTYRGESYAPTQLHVQGWLVGQDPGWEA